MRENTPRRQIVTRDALNVKAMTVPPAVAELVKKHQAGWSWRQGRGVGAGTATGCCLA